MNFKRVWQSEYFLLALLTLPAILSLLLNAGLPNTADGVLHVYRTFELDRAWLQVELVVRDQDFLRCNAIETRQRGHRLAAAVHKGLRQCQSPIDAVVRSYAANEGLKLRLHTK